MSESLVHVIDRIAGLVPPDRPAVICDGRVTTWQQLRERSITLAASLKRALSGERRTVALYMRNGPDYLTAFIACLRARLVSANINFRYGPEEVRYLLDNCDAGAVIFDAEFAGTLDGALNGAPGLLRICASGPASAGCVPISQFYDTAPGDLPDDCSADDIFLLYTGGTTGLPKGVMWPCGAMWDALVSSRTDGQGGAPARTLEETTVLVSRAGEARKVYVAPPFMHGTGLFSAISVLSLGGTVVCSSARSFDADAVVDALVHERCEGLVIVGDAFARPIVEAIASREPKPDLSCVGAVASSGMIWSGDMKLAMLEHMPGAVLADGLGASEASSIAFSISSRAAGAETTFQPVDVLVVDPDTLQPVQPGQAGVIAKAGPLPLGYYKDPDKTARTYVVIDGTRRMISGDHAVLEKNGAIRLLGRGSQVINTAGEKVFAEEIEAALTAHPYVADALVFGLPDQRLGQAVVAIASVVPGAPASDVRADLKGRLAGYKIPREIVWVQHVPRGPNGKADYARARELFDAAARG